MRVHFYATPSDIHGVCAEIEGRLDLKAYAAFQVRSRFPRPARATCYKALTQIPDLGVATSGDAARSVGYVLVDSTIDLQPDRRQIADPKRGEWEHYMRATLDERAADFRPGGVFGDNAIIMGEVMLQLSSPESRRIVRAFQAGFKRHYPARARGSFIGAEALERLHQGWHLTDYLPHPQPEILDIHVSELQMLN